MSAPRKFRKKPVVIEAVQLEDDLRQHIEVHKWINGNGGVSNISPFDTYITIRTLEGDMRADLGDWIIKGVNGEFYPCKPDIFAKTYEVAE